MQVISKFSTCVIDDPLLLATFSDDKQNFSFWILEALQNYILSLKFAVCDFRQ